MELKNNLCGGEKNKGIIMSVKLWANTVSSAFLLYLAALFFLMATNVIQPSAYLTYFAKFPSVVIGLIAILLVIASFALMSYGEKK